MRAPLFVLVLSACGGAEATATPAPAPTPTPARTTSALAWTWAGEPPSTNEPLPASTVDPGGLTCRFSSTGARSTLECVETDDGTRRWGLDVRDGSTAAALLRVGETLFVARYDRAGFGATVERYHLDRGERRWRVALAGLLVPIRGLAVQSIELADEEGALVVRGWDAGGRWAVAIDRDTGAVLDTAVFVGTGSPIAAPEAPTGSPGVTPSTFVAWQWDGPGLDALRSTTPPPEVGIPSPDGGRCVWRPEPNGDRSDDDRAHLECLDGSGARVWGIDDASPWPDMQGRALAIADGTLYVLAFHRAASGASVGAYALATGEERWQRWLVGIGPIDHSIYSAAAQLRVVGGRPLVVGWEAGGRYLEMLDPATGAVLYHRIVPDGE